MYSVNIQDPTSTPPRMHAHTVTQAVMEVGHLNLSSVFYQVEAHEFSSLKLIASITTQTTIPPC